MEAAWQLQCLPNLIVQLSRGPFETCCLGQLFKLTACQHTHNVDVTLLNCYRILNERLQQTW